jgi:CelD/BcsL family acetyltransferase involved in cellulose biosynthesis
LEPLLNEAFEIEAANWKGREGSALTMDTLRGPFYRRYAAAASRTGCLRLCFLHLGEIVVAMQFAIECGGSFWLLKIGYRDEFARCSPGMLLIAETIRYAAARGLASYEFLGLAESWTRVWTHDERPSATVRAYPIGWRGMSALGVDVFGVIAGKLKAAVSHRNDRAESGAAHFQ